MWTRNTCLILLSIITFTGCDRIGDDAEEMPAVPDVVGIVTLEKATQERLGVLVAPVQSLVIAKQSSFVGWLELPPAGQALVRSPIAGFVMASKSGTWPRLGQSIDAEATLGQVNVFLSPQEISQLIIAKEDNDIEMQQAVTTMELSQSQLEKLNQAREATTGTRINELKQALAHAQIAFKEAQEKLPFLVQEPYDHKLLVRPVELTVPRAGRVIQLHVVEGQFVQAGDPLWTIADWSQLWLRVPVSMSQLSKVALDRPASYPQGDITLSCPPITVPVEVNSTTRTVDLLYELPNSEGKRRVGQSVSVNLPTVPALEQNVSAVAIPRSAILYNEFGKASCYAVASSPDQFRRLQIELGPCDGSIVQVTRGLKASDVVVSIGAQQLAAVESKGAFAVDDDD